MAQISVVIPAYNERARLPGFLNDLCSELRGHPSPTVELVVSDDGSRAEDAETYRTAVEAASSFLRGTQHRVIVVRHEPNQGKASAIRQGWSESDARAEWLGFVDADGATNAAEVVRLIGLLPASTHAAVVGSRVKMAGHRVDRSAFRHVQGRVFATFVEVLFGLGLYDPQCGAKFFRASYLRPVLGRLEERGWLLDVEVMSLIHSAGGQLREEPIDWSDVGESKVRFGIDPARMFLGLVKLQRRLSGARE
jgi:dolichyl-phosphate beta-glucosyltransferase